MIVHYFSPFIESIKTWIYTTPSGFVAEIPKESHAVDLIVSRFSKLNNVNSLAKPSFLNQNLYGPWHVSADYLDVHNRYFSSVIYRNGTVEPVTLKKFMEIFQKIMSHEDLGNIRGIQAYRDHRIPLITTKSREAFTHCIEYRDSKYYSLIKNRKTNLWLITNN